MRRGTALAQVGGKVARVAAFEVEHSTSIYSGIIRMLDLALSGGVCTHPPGSSWWPPMLDVSYLPYGELEKHRESIGRFGSGLKAIKAVARSLP